MTWLGHENGCQIQSGAPCDCRLPGEDPCTCSRISAAVDPDCPLHGEGHAAAHIQGELDRLEREDPAASRASKGLDAVYGNVGGGLSRAELKAIYDPPEPRYLGTLAPDELEE